MTPFNLKDRPDDCPPDYATDEFIGVAIILGLAAAGLICLGFSLGWLPAFGLLALWASTMLYLG